MRRIVVDDAREVVEDAVEHRIEVVQRDDVVGDGQQELELVACLAGRVGGLLVLRTGRRQERVGVLELGGLRRQRLLRLLGRVQQRLALVRRLGAVGDVADGRQHGDALPVGQEERDARLDHALRAIGAPDDGLNAGTLLAEANTC